MSLKKCSLIVPSCSHLIRSPSPSTCPEQSCCWGGVGRCQGDSRHHGWLDRKCRRLSLSLLYTAPELGIQHWRVRGGRNKEDSENMPLQKSTGPWEDQYQPSLSEPALSGTQGTEKHLKRWPDASLLLMLEGQTEARKQRVFSPFPWRDQLGLRIPKAVIEERGLQPSLPIPQLPLPVIISFFLFLHCISGPRSTHPGEAEKRAGRGSVGFHTHGHV